MSVKNDFHLFILRLKLFMFSVAYLQVQIFWETTGKAQDQRASQKSQRHFNDFPDIDIVGLPRNKLSPLFIRQSIDVRASSCITPFGHRLDSFTFASYFCQVTPQSYL